MKKILLILAIHFSIVFNVIAQENIRKVAYILKTEATLFALQEIGATHSISDNPKCFYLDQIVDTLNKSISNEGDKWEYVLDGRNKNQRLA